MSADKLLSPQPSGGQSAQAKALNYIIQVANPGLLQAAMSCGGSPLTSPELEGPIFQIAEKIYDENGEPPSTKTHAAAHAAGFACAIQCLVAPVDTIRIYPDRKGYAGGVNYGKAERIASPSLSVFRNAIVYSSGFQAQQYMGMGHPSAEIARKFLSAVFASHLDKTFRKERGYFLHKAIAYNRLFLDTNRHAFNLLVFKLCGQMSISPEEAKEAFKRVPRVSLDLEQHYGGNHEHK